MHCNHPNNSFRMDKTKLAHGLVSSQLTIRSSAPMSGGWWSLKDSDSRLTRDKRRCRSLKNPCIIACFECDGALVSHTPLNHVIFSPKKYAKASWF